MKKVKIEINVALHNAYARIFFESKELGCGKEHMDAKGYKNTRSALNAAKRFCEEYGLGYEVVENGK